jgi:hypothetical protein
MQTFLPYPDLTDSARCLDYRRLGKQRVEAMQILNILTGKTNKPGWRNHPAVKMWKGHEVALGFYMNAMIDEWIRRGYNNTMKKADANFAWSPPWFGNAAFHASHRSNLLRKDPIYYGKFGWKEPSDLPYVWPTVS